MTSIALTNANNCQNQGKGCSTLNPTRIVGFFQRAFQKQVKKKRKEKPKAAFPYTHRILFADEREKKRMKEAQKNKAQSFLFRPVP